ncbi:MAG: EFR1 family ferrodoxin [Spirochaetaceae bacterium]|nr:EFR1 family ferrodoxin [Spirochaetaceae bacterium]
MKLNPNRIIDLYWFSGSGNTLFIARAIASFLGENGFEVNLKQIENTNPSTVDLNRTLGLAIPVAEQGTYPFIWNFIKNLPSPSEQSIKNTDVFMVDTLMIYSGGIKGPVKKILQKKGFNLLGTKEIIMPNNLMKLRNQPDKDRIKMERGQIAVEGFARNLISGKAVWRDIPLYSDMMGSFSKMNSTWNMFRNNFPLKVDNNICTRCRLCERICPVQSWTYNKDKNEMEWLKSDCIYCLRCFSYCPVEAISYGKKNYLRHKALTAGAFSASKYI